jgi:glutaredoxin
MQNPCLNPSRILYSDCPYCKRTKNSLFGWVLAVFRLNFLRASKGNPTSRPGSSYGLWKARQLNLDSAMPRIQISLNQFGRILNHPRDTFHTEVRGHSLDIIFTGSHPISGQFWMRLDSTKHRHCELKTGTFSPTISKQVYNLLFINWFTNRTYKQRPSSRLRSSGCKFPVLFCCLLHIWPQLANCNIREFDAHAPSQPK